jgi:hypothetical protein
MHPVAFSGKLAAAALSVTHLRTLPPLKTR